MADRSAMRLVVAGAGGRMGRMVLRVIAETPGVALVGAVEQAGSCLIGQDAGLLAGLPANGISLSNDVLSLASKADGVLDFTTPTASLGVLAGLPANGISLSNDVLSLASKADGVLDFTTPTASLGVLAATATAGIVHVIGTTGFAADEEKHIKAAAQRAPVVKSGNMSLGVTLLAALVKRVAASLDAEFDIEVVEMHHNQKADAPSGTALLLGQAVAEGRGVELSSCQLTARIGDTGARPPGGIGFAVLRGGTVVGDHTVIFAGRGERLELAHRAEDRSIFARGALKAALWARGKPPGLYSMADVLGVRET